MKTSSPWLRYVEFEVDQQFQKSKLAKEAVDNYKKTQASIA